MSPSSQSSIKSSRMMALCASGFLIAWTLSSYYYGLYVVPAMTSFDWIQYHYPPMTEELSVDSTGDVRSKTGRKEHDGRSQYFVFQSSDGSYNVSNKTYEDWAPSSRFAPPLSRPENYTSLLSMYGSHRVTESMGRLPDWLQEYFTWHAEQRRNESEDTKYLIIGCFLGDKCGGVSDRLRPLLYYLLIAHLSQRVLIIKWNKPHDISEFLMPAGDVDWRAPPEVDSLIIKNKRFRRQNDIHPLFGAYCTPVVSKTLNNCTKYIVDTMNTTGFKYHALTIRAKGHDTINTVNGYAQSFSYKNEMPCLRMWKYPDIFGDIFRVMFEPVPELAQQIKHTMTGLGLIENSYTSVHIRARYPTHYTVAVNRNADKEGGFDFHHPLLKSYLQNLALNAIDCSTTLQDGYPIFFVSDSHELVNYFVNSTDSTQSRAQKNNFDYSYLRAIQRKEETPHIDRDDGWPGSDPKYFYSVFEDLLILGGSKCVTHGIGSFGSFGAGLIGNACRAIHRRYDGKSVNCPNDRTDDAYCPINKTIYDLFQHEF